MAAKKLYRSKKDKIIFGVIGGLAEYFSIDVTLSRIVFIVFLSFTGFFPGIVAYIIAIFVMPKGK